MDTLAPIPTPSSPHEKEWVFEQLIEFNRRALGMTAEEYSAPLNFHLRDQAGEIMAGINATLLAQSSVYVAILWVNSQHRGMNYGSILLSHVETEAYKKGARLIHLDTLDFQAKDFYLKQGYTLYATLEDSLTQGRSRYYFCKRL